MASELKRWGVVVGITALFAVLYVGLRNLPDAQCGFLHYEVVKRADGSVEYCATSHAGFLDLSRLEYPVVMELEQLSAFEVGQGAEVSFVLETKGGMPIAPHDLAVTHTRMMHTMLIDSTLTDYHHVHPDAVGIHGDYCFEFKPEQPGPYRMLTEIVPVRTRRQVIASSQIDVAGAAGVPIFDARVTEDLRGGLRFVLSGVPEVLEVNRDYRLKLDVFDGQQSADLELIMGARAHMVAFDRAQKGFAHMHPESDVLGGVTETGEDGELAFLFNVPKGGWYRLFAQVQVDGVEVFGRFDLRVE